MAATYDTLLELLPAEKEVPNLHKKSNELQSPLEIKRMSSNLSQISIEDLSSISEQQCLEN